MVPLREHFLLSESALQPPPPFARLRISQQRSNASRGTRRFPGYVAVAVMTVGCKRLFAAAA